MKYFLISNFEQFQIPILFFAKNVDRKGKILRIKICRLTEWEIFRQI